MSAVCPICCEDCACDKCGCTNKYTNKCRKCKVILGPAGCARSAWPAGKNRTYDSYISNCGGLQFITYVGQYGDIESAVEPQEQTGTYSCV